MLRRFSLYGFCKNQQYFEPFFILIFLEKGLTFFSIGLLIAIRELTINLFEIITGAIADVSGRRRSMIMSFVSYVASFIIFGLATNLTFLFGAMFLYGIGEAFRTGTHKAMIFSWLKSQKREAERTAVYGFTRSWSKLGSALSVLVATSFVLVSNRFTPLFFLAIIPYIIGIINFLGYPKELDGDVVQASSFSEAIRTVAQHMRRSLSRSFRTPELRRILLESMGFEGLFRASKDYLQPVLKAAAIPVVAVFSLSDDLGESQQAALLVGPVYFFLYLLSAFSSRKAHRIVSLIGDEEKTARRLWTFALLLFVGLLPSLIFEIRTAIILGFVLLYALENIFRPVLIARIDTYCRETEGATIMSIENQVKSLSTMLLAPLIGAAVDTATARGLGGEFWPIGALGLLIAAIFFIKPPPRATEVSCG